MTELTNSSTDEMLKILKLLQTKVDQVERKLEERQSQMEQRLDALEEHLGDSLLLTRKRVSPARQDTLTVIQKLAGPDSYVSIRQISEKTKRSIQTEESYARDLHQMGIIRRQPFVSLRGNKKRREYRYRPKQ
jgi:hypothetical protein